MAVACRYHYLLHIVSISNPYSGDFNVQTPDTQEILYETFLMSMLQLDFRRKQDLRGYEADFHNEN